MEFEALSFDLLAVLFSYTFIHSFIYFFFVMIDMAGVTLMIWANRGAP